MGDNSIQLFDNKQIRSVGCRERNGIFQLRVWIHYKVAHRVA